MPPTLPPRRALALEHTWDTTNVFSSDEAWEAEIAQVAAQLPELGRFQSRLGEGPATLADWFEASEALFRRVLRVHLYASMNYHVDTADQGAAANYSRANALYAKTVATASFAEPELLAMAPETLQGWLRDEPRLAHLAHYVDTLDRRRAHVRSAEVEELLGQVLDPFATAASIHGVLADADLSFCPAVATERPEDAQEVAQSTINVLLTDSDREIRRSAWESYADAHLAVKNTMATCLATGVKQRVFVARARRYSSALEAALAASHIPLSVFTTLIDTFRRNLPTWHRYWRLRRQALGYETLLASDIKAPLTTTKPVVLFPQAIEWIAQGMQPLGDEYVQTLRRGALEERWVDIYPNQGKRAGAFSSGNQGTHPFIFVSYSDDLFSLSTLAHELGHSLHSYYSWQTQPYIYSRYSLFVAEVASNFTQALVRSHLLQVNPDPEFQLGVIEEAMANFHRYFFVMPILACFEQEIHARVERGQPLTADTLNALMADLFREGYGGEVDMEADVDRVGSVWAQFSTHLYANFYVYQYATGISGAHALAEKVLAGAPGAAENYLAFLKAGGSRYPLDALKLAGVDLASPEPVEQTFAVLTGLVDRLEMLVAQRPPASAARPI